MTSPAISTQARQPQEDNRILVISQVGGPPPHHGNRVRVATLLREMRQLGCEVHFAGVCMKPEEKVSTLPLVDRWVWDFEYAKPGHRGMLKPFIYLLQRGRRLLRRMEILEDPLDRDFCPHWLAEARELQRRLGYPRVLVVYVTRSKFLQAFPGPCLKILETQDCFTHRRQRLRTKGIPEYVYSLTRRDERRGLLRADRIIAIQHEEEVFFQELIGQKARVKTVGFFVSSRQFPPPPPDAQCLGFIASNNPINRQSQKWFFSEVWPMVQQRLPRVRAKVAGEICLSVQEGANIDLLGKIANPDEFYTNCPLMINPIQVGTGLKIKTIEALAYGRPIVSTSIGAEGLEEFCGGGIVVADSTGEFADAIVRLLADPPQAKQLGDAAFKSVQAYLEKNRSTFAEVINAPTLGRRPA